MKKEEINNYELKWRPIFDSCGIYKIIKHFSDDVKIALLEKIELLSATSPYNVKDYLTYITTEFITLIENVDDSDIVFNFNILDKKYNPIIEKIIYKHSDGKWYTESQLSTVKTKDVINNLDFISIINSYEKGN